MKPANNQLALARKVIERRIRHDKPQTVAEILFRELKRRIDAAREALRPLEMRLDELANCHDPQSADCMANRITIGELRKRLSEVDNATRAFCRFAEDVDAAIKADAPGSGENGGEK